MLKPGPERIRRLRFAGEKGVEDAMMIPATLPALVAVAKAADGLPWVLEGSLAASCWMESRATVVIEVLVPGEEVREAILGRVGALPQGYEVRVRTAEELGLGPEAIVGWHARARRDVIDGVAVIVPVPRDLFLMMLSENDVIGAPRAMFFACRLHQLHGRWDFQDMELSPYQSERFGEAAAKIIKHVAWKLEALEVDLKQAFREKVR